ncbi:laccase domain-containing protein [Pseudarthrobacter sp. P1]|uniref:laccase domain-containing protein n=1 Tax=Pseudarthrobacter sp. P1 TaxID=3418418 RepID=UPI003CFAAA93
MVWWHEEVSPGIWVGFTGADAGNLAFHVGGDAGEVRANRAALAVELGLDTAPAAARLQFMDQVHGNDVAVVSAGDFAPEAGPTADAMVSLGEPLAVLVADCVPVVLVGARADHTPVLAVAHAGRPGVATSVVPRTVAAMRGQGAVSIRAWLGPSVCGACYEVPAALRDEVAAVAPASWSTTSWGTPALDLPAAVLAQLAAAGVAAQRIKACTLQERGLFSHRRFGREGGSQGRFAGVVHARH